MGHTTNPALSVHPRIDTNYDLTQTDCSDGPLSLEPSCTVLHYAQTIFEGMKAYRQDSGKVTLFRPDMNMKRMNTSAQRIALPVRPLPFRTVPIFMLTRNSDIQWRAIT